MSGVAALGYAVGVIPTLIKGISVLCKNCRVSELRSARAVLHGTCGRCLRIVDEYIRSELRCVPDYAHAIKKDGVRYIPVKGI